MSPRRQSKKDGRTDAPETIVHRLPLVPLRDFVVFPGMVTPLLIGRPKSVAAIENALDYETRVVLAAQKEARIDDPSSHDIHTVGVLAELLHTSQASEDGIKVLVEGHGRVNIEEYLPATHYLEVNISEIEETGDDGAETHALMRTVVDLFEQYVQLGQRVPSEVLVMASGIDDPSALADTIAAQIAIKTGISQSDRPTRPVVAVASTGHRPRR